MPYQDDPGRHGLFGVASAIISDDDARRSGVAHGDVRPVSTQSAPADEVRAEQLARALEAQTEQPAYGNSPADAARVRTAFDRFDRDSQVEPVRRRPTQRRRKEQ